MGQKRLPLLFWPCVGREVLGHWRCGACGPGAEGEMRVGFPFKKASQPEGWPKDGPGGGGGSCGRPFDCFENFHQRQKLELPASTFDWTWGGGAGYFNKLIKVVVPFFVFRGGTFGFPWFPLNHPSNQIFGQPPD